MFMKGRGPIHTVFLMIIQLVSDGDSCGLNQYYQIISIKKQVINKNGEDRDYPIDRDQS